MFDNDSIPFLNLDSDVNGISTLYNEYRSMAYPTVIDADIDCGDLTDIAQTTFVNETQCNMACSDRSASMCIITPIMT
jgi:hypothetical protein